MLSIPDQKCCIATQFVLKTHEYNCNNKRKQKKITSTGPQIKLLSSSTETTKTRKKYHDVCKVENGNLSNHEYFTKFNYHSYLNDKGKVMGFSDKYLKK